MRINSNSKLQDYFIFLSLILAYNINSYAMVMKDYKYKQCNDQK